jgi:DNA-binding MarR family transcriptional regulator
MLQKVAMPCLSLLKDRALSVSRPTRGKAPSAAVVDDIADAEYTVSRPALLVDDSDAAFRDFIHDFLAFSSRVAQIRAGFGQSIGLTGIAYTTLMSIAHLQGEEGIGVARLAEHMHLSGAFVTIEVTKLVTAGLVEKQVNAKDRRRVLLTVASEGRRALQGLKALQVPINDALFECLTRADFDRFRQLTASLVTCGERALIRQRDLMGVNPLEIVPDAGSVAPKPATRRKRPTAAGH